MTEPNSVTDARDALDRAYRQAAEDAMRSAERITTAEQALADALAARTGTEGR